MKIMNLTKMFLNIFKSKKQGKDDRFSKLIDLLNGTTFFWHTLNMSDTFGYGCSDSEDLDILEFKVMFPLYEKYGHDAFVAYTSVKRDCLPVKEFQSKEFFEAKKEIEILSKDGTILYEQYWRKRRSDEEKLIAEKGEIK